MSFIIQTRKAHGVELQGNIVIFDEAHNLVSIPSLPVFIVDLSFITVDFLQCLVFLEALFAFNPLPDDKILDWSKLKQIADDILKCI